MFEREATNHSRSLDARRARWPHAHIANQPPGCVWAFYHTPGDFEKRRTIFMAMHALPCQGCRTVPASGSTSAAPTAYARALVAGRAHVDTGLQLGTFVLQTNDTAVSIIKTRCAHAFCHGSPAYRLLLRAPTSQRREKRYRATPHIVCFCARKKKIGTRSIRAAQRKNGCSLRKR